MSKQFKQGLTKIDASAINKKGKLSKQQRKQHKQARQLRQAARGKYWLNNCKGVV